MLSMYLLQSLGPLLPGNLVELQLNLLPLAAGLQVCFLNIETLKGRYTIY